MILRRALALVAASSVAFVSACAGGDSRETVVETSVKWVNPDGSEIEGVDEPDGEKGSSTSSSSLSTGEIIGIIVSILIAAIPVAMQFL